MTDNPQSTAGNLPAKQQPATLSPLQAKVQSVRNLFERCKAQINMALPSHLKADRLIRIAMTMVQKNPRLLECTPQSLLGALMECAQLGLEPDSILGHAYFVPFRVKRRMPDGSSRWVDEVTMIPGYKGLIKLVRNSGQLSTIVSQVVYKQDEYDVMEGTDPKIVHKRTEEGPGMGDDAERPDPTADVRAFYSIVRLKDGGLQFINMWKWEVNRIRNRSQSYKAYLEKGFSTPWVTDYEEMGKKTTIRRICKLLPMSVEVQRAVALDERADAGISQELGDFFDIMGQEQGDLLADQTEEQRKIGNGQTAGVQQLQGEPPKTTDDIVRQRRGRQAASGTKPAQQPPAATNVQQQPPQGQQQAGDYPKYGDHEEGEPPPGVGIPIAGSEPVI